MMGWLRDWLAPRGTAERLATIDVLREQREQMQSRAQEALASQQQRQRDNIDGLWGRDE